MEDHRVRRSGEPDEPHQLPLRQLRQLQSHDRPGLADSGQDVSDSAHGGFRHRTVGGVYSGIMKFSRRTVMEVLGAGALTPAAAIPATQVPAAPKEGAGTPKIALGMGDGGFSGGRRGQTGDAAAADPMAGPRRIKQLGVNHVLGGGGAVPWTEESLRATMDRWK